MKLQQPQTLYGPTLLIIILLAITSTAAHALTHSDETVDNLRFTVYAPDWTWQDRDINVLIVLENRSGVPADVSVTLSLPPGKQDHFEYQGDTRATITVPPGKVLRHAFTNIRALGGVPRQVYPFELSVEHDGRRVQVPYPMRTIRGAAVSPGKWALFLPVGLALLWCMVFVLVMGRIALPRAWRTSTEPVTFPEHRELWIDREPT